MKLLKDDHEVVKKLFDEFEAAERRSAARIARQAITELDIHADIEEEIFYPAVDKAVGDEMVMAEAEQEPHVVHPLIAALKEMLEGGKSAPAGSPRTSRHARKERTGHIASAVP